MGKNRNRKSQSRTCMFGRQGRTCMFGRQGGCPCCPADNSAAQFAAAQAKSNESNQKQMMQMQNESAEKVATASKPTIIKKSVVGEVFYGIGGLTKTLVVGTLTAGSALIQGASNLGSNISGGLGAGLGLGIGAIINKKNSRNSELDEVIDKNALVINYQIPNNIMKNKREYLKILKNKILACSYIITAISDYVNQPGWDKMSSLDVANATKKYLDYAKKTRLVMDNLVIIVQQFQ